MSGMGSGWGGGFAQASWDDLAFASAAWIAAAWIVATAFVEGAWSEATNPTKFTGSTADALIANTGQGGVDGWRIFLSASAGQSTIDAEKEYLIAAGASRGMAIPDMWRQAFGRKVGETVLAIQTRHIQRA